MQRTTKAQLAHKLAEVATLYTVPNGKHLSLDHYAMFGGYRLVLIDDTTGGEWDICPTHRVPARAMYDVLQGMLIGLTNATEKNA